MAHIGHKVAAHPFKAHELGYVVEDDNEADPGLGTLRPGQDGREDPAVLQAHMQGYGVPADWGRSRLLLLQHFQHGILQGREGHNFHNLAPPGTADGRKASFHGPVAAADMPFLAQHQDAVAHGVEYGLKLGCLVSLGLYLLLNAVGHGIHGLGKRGKFPAGVA